MSYSVPVRQQMTLDELLLHSLPERPDDIPCAPATTASTGPSACATATTSVISPLVVVDGTLAPGHLTLAEFVVPGRATTTRSWSTPPSALLAGQRQPRHRGGGRTARALGRKLAAPRTTLHLRARHDVGSLTAGAAPGVLPRVRQPTCWPAERRRHALRSPRNRRGSCADRPRCAHVLAGIEGARLLAGPTATTSASTARPASTCRWGG